MELGQRKDTAGLKTTPRETELEPFEPLSAAVSEIKAAPSEPKRPGIGAETLRAAGIHNTALRYVEIPYHDLHGQRTGFSRWRLAHERPNGQRYDQPPSSGVHVYFPPGFKDHAPGGDLCICEGEFKALALKEAGYKAIATPGIVVYMNDATGEPQLLPGIFETIAHTKPARILFQGDSDTATNYEFSRNAVFLAGAVTPLPVVLPRIPIGGRGKGVDDCRGVLGEKFPEFWAGIVESAEGIDTRAGVGVLAVRLLEREAKAIKASVGIERDKLTRRIVDMAVKCRNEPVAKNGVMKFAEKHLGIPRTAFKEEMQMSRTGTHEDTDHSGEERSADSTTIHGKAASDQEHAGMLGGEGEAPQGKSLFNQEPATPCVEAVDGVELLNELKAVLCRYLVLSQHVPDTLALFIVATYALSRRVF